MTNTTDPTPGILNEPDLIEECAEAIFHTWAEIEGSGATWRELVIMNEKDGYGTAKKFHRMAFSEARSVMSVLRRRGLLTEQAIALLQTNDKGEE